MQSQSIMPNFTFQNQKLHLLVNFSFILHHFQENLTKITGNDFFKFDFANMKERQLAHLCRFTTIGNYMH